MKTCSRCGRPDAPGSSIPKDRSTCNPCRRGSAPTAAPAPRDPITIIAENRRRAEAARREVEFASMATYVERLERDLAAVRVLQAGRPPMAPIVRAPARPGKSEVVPLILASDWHVEERVDKDKMHGTNEYTLEIARKRSERFFESASKLIEQAEKASSVGRVAVGLLGDFFSGSIHEELMEVNQLGPAPAAAYSKQLLSRGIRFWQEQHPGLEFSFHCVGGNHGRMTHKTRISTNAENSLESFMFQFLAAEHPNAKWHIAPGDELYADLFPDYRARFIHGDQIGFQGGVGGISIPLNKWTMRANQTIHADMTCLGHFHQSRADRDWLCNGSLIGPSPYSKRLGFAPERPKQQFALVHAKHGRTLVADIWVEG